MRSKTRQGWRLTFHPIVVASAVVFTVLFLALGYHTGVNHVEQTHQPRMSELREALKKQKGAVESCNKKIRDLALEVSKSDTRLNALTQALRLLRKEQTSTETVYNTLDRDNTKCEMDREEIELRLRHFDEQDEYNRLSVEEMQKEVDALEVSILHITRGEGMSIVLLSEVLKSLRAAYEAKCRALPGCVELTDDDLLKLRVEGNHTEEEIKAFLERDAAAQKSLVNSLQKPNANLTGIYFLPMVSEELMWDAKEHYPKYFERTITQKPLRGVKGKTMPVLFAGNVMNLLESYSDYAMCAFRHNNSGFSFQSTFSYVPESGAAVATTAPLLNGKSTAYLHKLIVSPLLQYCVQCDAQLWTQPYRLACFKDRMGALSNYGTHDFWVVRSMIQAAPGVQTAALNYFESYNAEELNVLAVVLHLASERDREECDHAASHEYGIHYQYLMANFPNDTALKLHVADEQQAQCSPTAAQIIEHIERVRGASKESIDKIYLSVSAEMQSHVLALLKESGNTALLNLLLPTYTNPEQEATTPGFTEVVDLEIASRAHALLVSPFMRASRYVSEQFLLRHHLNPSNRIWVF